MSMRILILLLMLGAVVVVSVTTQDALASTQGGMSKEEKCLLFLAEGILFFLVLVCGPIYARCIAKTQGGNNGELRGLNLPRGSIRSMLALLSVGSFLIFLVLGDNSKNFSQVVTALGTLTGSVMGFYFGHRGGSPPPKP